MAEKQGKQNAVSGGSFGSASDFVSPTPGKGTLLGNQWAQHGAFCDGKDIATVGCFMEKEVRFRYLVDFKDDVVRAAGNYKAALADLRVDELMKKDDDLNWVLSLALEIAGAHIVEMAVKGLSILKSSATQQLAGAALQSGESGGFSGNLARALGGVSTKHLETLAKTPINSVKGRLTSGMKKRQNREANTEKNAVIAYIDQLRNQCETAYKTFESIVSATASDVELAVFVEGMDPDNHSVDIYKDLLSEKLDRFRTSGVLDIGRKAGRDRETGYADVYRDTRVVWVRDFLGNRRLYFQSQEGNADRSVVRPGEPGMERVFPEQTFGPHDAREAPVLGDPVPDEFRDVAIARSQQQWGLINEIEDPYTKYMRWRGIDVTKVSPSVAPKPDTLPKGTASLAATMGAKGSSGGASDAKPSAAPQPIDAAPPVSTAGSDPAADLGAAGM